MYSRKVLKKTTLGAAVLLALGSGAAHAVTTDGNNFTMIGGTGLLTGGTNDVTFTWDGTFRTAVVTDGTSNASLSSPTPFFGKLWTAKNVNVYGPGTYTFNVGCPAGDPACTTATTSKRYELTVPLGYVGAHMLFDWSTSTNIDVVQLWKMNTSWNDPSTGTDNEATGSQFCDATWTTAGCNTNPNPNGNTEATVFNWLSMDTPNTTIRLSDGSVAASEPSENNIYHGTKMIDGPFVGQSANFSVNIGVDTTPDAFTLSDKVDVAPGSTVTSDPITVTKSGSSSATFLISVTGDSSSEFSINGGSFTTIGLVTTGQTVTVRHTAASSACGTVDTTLTIGGVSDTFTSTALGASCSDTKPDGFILTSQSDVALSSTITSNTITVRGITIDVDISVSGDPSSRYSVNGGPCTNTSGTVALNDTVSVCHTSAATNSTTTSTVLSIGGVSDATNSVSATFTSTTVAATVSTDAGYPGKMPTGGCSINPVQAKASSHADWWLVAGFMAWLGALRLRFKHQARS